MIGSSSPVRTRVGCRIRTDRGLPSRFGCCSAHADKGVVVALAARPCQGADDRARVVVGAGHVEWHAVATEGDRARLGPFSEVAGGVPEVGGWFETQAAGVVYRAAPEVPPQFQRHRERL